MELEKAIEDYRQWMILNRYAEKTCSNYHKLLIKFVGFVRQRKLQWNDIFTYETLAEFQNKSGHYSTARAIRGLSRYLFECNQINRPIEKQVSILPEIFEEYLDYRTYVKEINHSQIVRTRKTLSAFCDFLETNNISLKSVKIEQIDTFFAEHNRRYTKIVGGMQRSTVRIFLAWLYQNKVIKKNIAAMIVGAPIFTKKNPPKFLRPHEIQTLFLSLTGQTPIALRTTAEVYLGFYLGLRPIEISRIELDNIDFKKQKIQITHRKNTKAINLPLPECCIKVVAAYILGGRPVTDDRRLFITAIVPYRPVLPISVSSDITRAMKRAGIESSSYWLRHTYAQNLLEAGVSFFEIKEMMGHDRIQSTRRYLHIHTKLMRKVLFDEDDI